MNKQDELLMQVVERYIFHRDYVAENLIADQIAKDMCDIEITEMWMLTQN